MPKLKPEPAPLLLHVDRLGADPGFTLYLGDSESDAETAFRAKVPFVLFSDGYLKETREAFEPIKVFDHFEGPPDSAAGSTAAR